MTKKPSDKELEQHIQKMMAKERERLINDRQAALGEIKTVKKIVPICSKCKTKE